MKKPNYEMDMCAGALLPKLLLFAIPLMLSGILQLLFNAADMVVIGQYSTTNALAAIGATSSLINFYVNIIMGISVGSNVIVARYYGGQKKEEVHDAVHTSILICLILGFVVGILAILTARSILAFMDTPEDVMDLALLYIRIYFAGLPGIMLYNFGSAILRAIGDTKRPLFFLVISGIINVVLNLFFVIKLHMSVDGVALATIISQTFAALMVLRCLMKCDGSYQLRLGDLRINRRILFKILQIGLPAGIQGMIFSVSNLLIQSSVNFFGPIAMAGNTTCSNIENFVYTSMNSVYQTALSFTSQNIGGGKYSRINKIMVSCLMIVTMIGLIMGNLINVFGTELLGLYTLKTDVIAFGLKRMQIICTTYFLCGLMDVLVGVIRGLGYGILPMIVSLIGACGLRILWIFTIFQDYHKLEVLYCSYPVTWLITALAHLICFLIIRRKYPRKDLSY